MKDTTETILDTETHVPQILASSGPMRTTRPTYVPSFDYLGFVRHATEMLKALFREDYPITRKIHDNKSQNTFVMKGVDKYGNGHVIKALLLPPCMSISEREEKRKKFAQERDLVEAFGKIMRGEGIAQVTGYGTKYPAKLEGFFDEVRAGIMPFTVPYFATAHLCGGDLEKMVRHNFSIKKRVTVFRKIAGTLSFLHSSYHILHKDVKPANILFDMFDNPCLIDLGVVETIGQEKRRAEAGSMPYLSPDQAKGFIALKEGRELPVHTHRTDMYSFGLVLGDMIHKYHPRNPVDIWDGYFDNEDDFIEYIAKDPVVIFPDSGVNELDDIIHRTVSNTKKDQFSSMRKVHEELYKLECKL